MFRAAFITWFAFALLGTFASGPDVFWHSALGDDHAKVRPNVLFILSEDQGAHLGFLKTPGLKTPNLDRLARSSSYFSNAFVAYPVCSASKAAIYTGLHNHTNGILNNTYNYHKPAAAVTANERQRPLWKTNRIRDRYLTLTEILKANGYYQGVTHKLHVLPNEKFPYDEFLGGSVDQLPAFLSRAKQSAMPWFLLVNLPNSHRPYPNSDRQPIRVDPNRVKVPSFLPDTPTVRKDWAEYLAAIEEVDALVGKTIEALHATGQQDHTIVIFMSDHGPTFQHGKMTLYDLGLRVPLMIRQPGQTTGTVREQLASELDLLPTLLELIENHSSTPLTIPGSDAAADDQPAFPYPLHGVSLASVLTGGSDRIARDVVFAEISNRGPLPNDGMQERAVLDGRWKLIYREKVETNWRQVNADSRDPKPWGNRVYAETLRVREAYPDAYRVLREMDPQNLGGPVPRWELYDLDADPDEMNNLAHDPRYQAEQDRLTAALRDWVRNTHDPAVSP